jgi:hypothetical protein
MQVINAEDRLKSLARKGSKGIGTRSEICPFLRRMSKPLLVSPSCLYAKYIRSAVWEMHLERIIITDIQLDCSLLTSYGLVCGIQTGKKTDSSMRSGVTLMDPAYFSSPMHLSIQLDDLSQKHIPNLRRSIVMGDYV